MIVLFYSKKVDTCYISLTVAKINLELNATFVFLPECRIFSYVILLWVDVFLCNFVFVIDKYISHLIGLKRVLFSFVRKIVMHSFGSKYKTSGVVFPNVMNQFRKFKVKNAGIVN